MVIDLLLGFRRGKRYRFDLIDLRFHGPILQFAQVALTNGIVMGGGASMVVPAKFSVVTEKTVPDFTGEFLALTSARLNGKEMIAAGLATHFVPSEIRRGRNRTLAECLKNEFRLTMNLLRSVISSDVYEVNILVVCVGTKLMVSLLSFFFLFGGLERASEHSASIRTTPPRTARLSDDVWVMQWSPSSLQEVSAEKVDLVFEPFAEDLELEIPADEKSRLPSTLNANNPLYLVSRFLLPDVSFFTGGVGSM
ncbi:hypothetical protein B296_00013148 [Ensete ventricosum]|uniref:3-hydroxyisobutyryl-CoA hydrolase n=1 Tax=Ensete ventricosum TaxID=4639 RepID=A0A427AQL7_ENSVE|nr:hypothetical protein B296_00013148 [Ensete ventricosum]